MKYKRVEDESTLRGKLHKLNIHSIRKKGDRFAGYLKILTGVEPQVGRKKHLQPAYKETQFCSRKDEIKAQCSTSAGER